MALDISYQEHGLGKPLLLIHSGTDSADSWQSYLPAFAEHYRVIAPDSRGHGRTNNPARTMSYRLFADDMAALVQTLGLYKPLIFGYSDGGQVALELGMRYPDLPQALVVGAAWFRFSEAYRAWVRELALATNDRRRLIPSSLRATMPVGHPGSSKAMDRMIGSGC